MIKIKTDLWVTSQNEEMFSGEEYATKEKAIEGGKKEYAGESFWIGKINKLKFDDNEVDASDFISEQLYERLHEECGDAAEGWEVTNKLLCELGERIGRVTLSWMEEFGLQPSCYNVDNIEFIEKADQEGEE